MKSLVTGALESEWSGSLESFLFVCFCHTASEAQWMPALPALCQPCPPTLEFSTLCTKCPSLCLGVTKIFCVGLTSEPTPRISDGLHILFVMTSKSKLDFFLCCLSFLLLTLRTVLLVFSVRWTRNSTLYGLYKQDWPANHTCKRMAMRTQV